MTALAASIDNPARQTSGKGLRATLWVVQALLAAAFGVAGLMKATAPLADLAARMPWTTALPGAAVRFIGFAELLGAVGLILPSLTRIRPGLTALAAAGLALVMALAAIFHVARGEMGALPINLALGGLAAFVAWGRARLAR